MQQLWAGGSHCNCGHFCGRSDPTFVNLEVQLGHGKRPPVPGEYISDLHRPDLFKTCDERSFIFHDVGDRRPLSVVHGVAGEEIAVCGKNADGAHGVTGNMNDC